MAARQKLILLTASLLGISCIAEANVRLYNIQVSQDSDDIRICARSMVQEILKGSSYSDLSPSIQITRAQSGDPIRGAIQAFTASDDRNNTFTGYVFAEIGPGSPTKDPSTGATVPRYICQIQRSCSQDASFVLFRGNQRLLRESFPNNGCARHYRF